MKHSRAILGFGLACIALSGPSAAQGHGHGSGGGGGGGGGGGPAMPAIAFNDGGHLAVMDADGSNATQVLPYAGEPSWMEPSWSPDGTQIVFNGTIAGPGLYTIRVDGTGLTLIKPANLFDRDGDGIPESPGSIDAPAWSPVPAPDGHYKILFCEEVLRPDGGTKVEVAIVDPDGTGYQQLTDDFYFWPFDVTWSPQADRFAAAAVDFEVFLGDCLVYDLSASDGVLSASAGASVTRLPGSPLENADSIAWVDWANDSDTLAVAAAVQGGFSTWTVEIENPTSPLELGGNTTDRQPSWSPDDAWIVYWRTGPGPDGIFARDSLDAGDPIELHRGGSAPDWRR